MLPTDEVDKGTGLPRAVGRLAWSLGSWVVIMGAAVVVVRLASNPDAARTAYMRACRVTERAAMAQARLWANVADNCAAAYENARASV